MVCTTRISSRQKSKVVPDISERHKDPHLIKLLRLLREVKFTVVSAEYEH